MSIIYCKAHRLHWDDDNNDNCPQCEERDADAVVHGHCNACDTWHDCDVAMRCLNPERVGGPAELDWHAVALMIGERLADTGPENYYDMKPYQWLEYADKAVQERKTSLLLLAKAHYWDSLEPQRVLILAHIKALLK